MSQVVLIIDDDAIVRRTLESVLQDARIETVSAGDGREGMTLFRSLDPAVVVTDIIMPDQEGIETIIQMRRERPDTKILAISGGGRIGNMDFLEIARRLGADRTLAKPFQSEELLGVLHALGVTAAAA